MPHQESQTSKKTPTEASIYALPEVVRYLHIPVVAAYMLNGREYPLAIYEARCFWSHLDEDSRNDCHSIFNNGSFPRLTFQQLARTFLLYSVFRAMTSQAEESGHWVEQLIKFCKSPGVLETKDHEQPFQYGNACDLAVKIVKGLGLAEKLSNKIMDMATLCADRIIVEEGMAVQLFPFSRGDFTDSPSAILINPRKRFGQPIIAGTSTPTEVIVERFLAGDSITALAEDYSIDRALIEEALRYEQLSMEHLSTWRG